SATRAGYLLRSSERGEAVRTRHGPRRGPRRGRALSVSAFRDRSRPPHTRGFVTAFSALERASVRPAEEAGPQVDQRRLRALIDEHHDFLWRSLRRLGLAEAHVDDAAQHVWLVISRKLSEIRVGGERAYLFGVAMRVASNARRVASRREVP